MKSPEQQLVDLFHKFSVQRFNHAEFARLLAEQDEDTQRTFFLSNSAYVAYKSAFADNYPYEISPDTLAGWCQAMYQFMQEYGEEVLPRPNTRNELI
jgi:hypothetical protein